MQISTPAFCPTAARLKLLFAQKRPNQLLETNKPSHLKSASVLIPIVYDARHCQIILTLRQDHLPQHGGQVAFPGGRPEPSDGCALRTALREAEEEIALPCNAVSHTQQLPAYKTFSGYYITPFAGLIAAHYLNVLEPQPSEVKEIFTLPLSHVLNPARYQSKVVQQNQFTRSFYALEFKQHYIWGATADMLYQLRIWLWHNLRGSL